MSGRPLSFDNGAKAQIGIFQPMIFNFFSIAAFSTWLHNEDFDFLIDAGEGAASMLGMGKLSSLRTIFLTHDHFDHIAGLLQILNLRARNPGLPRLVIYYPYGSHKLDAIQALMPDTAEWIQLHPGIEIPLGPKAYMKAFSVRHASDRAVGYALWESRTRRKAEYSHLSAVEMGAMAREMRAGGLLPSFDENVEFHLLSYTGDTMALDNAVLGHPQVLVHEATYPLEEMLEHQEHSSLETARRAAKDTGAETVILMHLSRRYRDVPEPDFGAMIPVLPDRTVTRIVT